MPLPQLWIGTSGYVYPHWRKGVFYPHGLPPRDELSYFAARFRTVELNNPFYRVPAPETFARWREVTPPDFVFAVKANRFITHVKRLHDCGEPVADFLARANELTPKLGPLLFQLPPNFQADLARLEEFLTILPSGPRWVIEFRHPSWHVPAVYQRLGQRGVALCIPIGGRVRPDLVTTTDFAYFRMHSGRGPAGGFTPAQLRDWAGRIRALRQSGKTIYVYFNNDREAHAIRDAARLEALLGVER